MSLRLLSVGLIVGLTACSTGSSSSSVPPPEKVFQETERAPVQNAGWCSHCNFFVHEGHRCGRTAPCQLCKREIGQRHYHEIVWNCDPDELVMSRQHICNDAKTCEVCRQDKRALLGTRGCERCFRQVPPVAVRGITSYCQTCDQEVGANHIHGKTAFCQSCLREAGPGHKCDATRLCMEHETEHAPDHMHGTTSYCTRCHRDSGEGHKHGLTEWCWRCSSEMEWPHCHHN